MFELSDPVVQLAILTVLRTIIGAGMIFVLVGSLYQFKKSILTLMGFMLISNFLCLVIILGMLTS
jgi:hypothetical protein